MASNQEYLREANAIAIQAGETLGRIGDDVVNFQGLDLNQITDLINTLAKRWMIGIILTLDSFLDLDRQLLTIPLGFIRFNHEDEVLIFDVLEETAEPIPGFTGKI